MQKTLAETTVETRLQPSAPVPGGPFPSLLATGEHFPKRVHLLGAGGAGVSGMGRILHARGARVSGHDRSESELLRALAPVAAALAVGESTAAYLPDDADLVIRSAAVPDTDPQVQAARARGIPVLKYGEALARIARPARVLGVAGTHGKTTTSWMLWHALEGIAEALQAPVSGALIGGVCRRLETSALAGTQGGWFCVEACEYDRTFLNLRPRGAVVTNVEEDHLDYYGTFAAIRTAFARYLSGVASDGLVVLGRGVPDDVEHGTSSNVWRLGRELEVDLYGEDRGAFRFRLRGPGWATPEVRLGVPGHFNVENAALALALAVGISRVEGAPEPAELAAAAAAGIERFLGVARRFELWGTADDVDVVHDYAHHPTEVRATLEAARRAFGGRPLHVLFQPHQYSRTARFLEAFAESLRGVDRVVVADVYGARAHVDGERLAGARELVLALRQRGLEAEEGGGLDTSTARFVAGLPSPAAAFVLGAGDIEWVRDDLLQKLALRGARAR